MAKELFISSSPHETKVAVLEDDQLVEVYFERETDAGVVGGIYKGRVSRVLPGMQSAFVNIGLERDAFLYVSDFFLEDSEDFDKIFDDAESRVIQASTTNVSTPAVAPTEVLPVKAASEPVVVVDVAHRPAAPGPEITDAAVPEIPPLPPAVEVAVVTPPSEGGGLPSSRPTAAPPAPPERRSDKPDFRRYEPRGRRRKRRGGRNFGERPFTDHRPFRPEAEPHSFEVLPGESLAKYRHKSLEAPRVETSISGTSEAPISESPEVPEAAREFSPISEVPEGFFPEPGPSETFGRGLKEGEAPAAPTNLVVGSDSGPREGTTGSSEISQTATGGREVPAAPVSAVEPLMEVQERILPFHPAEAIPSATAKARDVRVPAFSELPSTAKEESAQITPEVSVESAEEVEGSMQGEEEDTEPESMSDDEIEAQGDAGDESISGEPEAFGEDLVEDTQEQVEAPDEPGVLTQPPAQPTGDSAERTYTLREPHQRPHYAPRRVRRGRRGMGGRRPVRRESPRPGNNQPVQIAEILKEGQEILVQIAKEPLGTKGARITSHIALPGRYLVYMSVPARRAIPEIRIHARQIQQAGEKEEL